MNPNTSLLNDLDRVARIRQAIAAHLSTIATTLTAAEAAEQTSGKLGLDSEIVDLSAASQNLQQGVFRLLVLGDMKRGKSTFLNALMGENLLPSDVNPCTALLTILRYGAEKRVTVYFNDGKPAEQIDFVSFKQRYTINPEEAKSLEQSQKQAFPHVSHAVVEYPLALLQKGIEIVDSPGLNDTEARNELSLGYLNNCHAVLFVLRASQPCTLAERRYLENYVKDRGLTIFFLINAWDQVKESLIDPDDSEELQTAETKLRQVFHTNLAPYCQVEGFDIYEERVFELSAIQALRRRIKDGNASLEGTGFPNFLQSLNTFLTQERAVAELRQARSLARQVSGRVNEAIARRIPLLDQSVDQLKLRLASVEPQFAQLSQIRDRFSDEICATRDRKARAIADSFRTYVLNLEHSFEQDFLRYQPASLSFLDFFNQGKREQFSAAFEQAFQQYANDKFFAWSLTAEKDLKAAFAELSQSAARYGASYSEVTDQISELLTGQKLQPRLYSSSEDNFPGWAKWAMGLFSLAYGNVAGAALAVGGFDFKSVLLNFFTAAGIAIIASSIFGIMLGPLTFALVGLGIGALQADHARQEIAKATQRELVKYLPQVAQEQWQPIYNAVQECFDKYEREVNQRMNDDIQSRKTELETLLQQKQSREIDRAVELERLKSVETTVTTETQAIEATYQTLLL
ncbi:MAG TPA: dynamin family protein [Coleofasciculaceae cyanobacterium]|jgi:GTPase SAR1 family protein